MERAKGYGLSPSSSGSKQSVKLVDWTNMANWHVILRHSNVWKYCTIDHLVQSRHSRLDSFRHLGLVLHVRSIDLGEVRFGSGTRRHFIGG